ncbi:MAG: pyruvate dehydrogenase (acetyl-transferring) E1 component subunit alpha [Dehalococcoidales bacterium]|jgi:pyruvate dehydrogenase E1 component alpha subunit|nr:pyruvate dehydrogenase (acetyl-transferring) E1 component subunit alpha [Dehalococcoidales bacterium]HJO32689.1 thiamine pyrophosphate-dependent dehydrogenase E1 component subunit alpha [Anaerolineales bacterium]|tara:strand:- start:9329 stop:10291 length:963 start_codon:yes stop_codon:yes gene_type:complete
MKISKKLSCKLLRKMHLIRAFEQQAERSYMEGKIHGTMHLSIGQEATAVGSISTLNPDDYILSTHRGHGHCIAKEPNLDLVMAEFYGKEVGYCRGRGGSMHIADVAGGNLGANGVVGGGVAMSVGVGLGIKMRHENRVLICFFGDGAASTGAFHESMILAGLFHIPVVYLCENNQYAMSFPVKNWATSARLAQFGELYGILGSDVDGNDILAVRRVVQTAVDRARAGDGPSLVVADTYRFRGHSRSDRNRYRRQEEIEEWQLRDPIIRFRNFLTEEALLTTEEMDEIEEQALADIEAARIFAETAPEPALDTIEEGVFAP